MIKIKIDKKEGMELDRALKVLKNKFNKMGIIKELRERREFVKKSVRRRQRRIKAIYKECIRQRIDNE